MCDWNDNGKYDMEDAFINYHIYKSISKNEQNNSNNNGNGCLAMMVLAIFAMPIAGIYLLAAGKSSDQRFLGLALFIVSIIVYAKFGMIWSKGRDIWKDSDIG